MAGKKRGQSLAAQEDSQEVLACTVAGALARPALTIPAPWQEILLSQSHQAILAPELVHNSGNLPESL